MDDGRPVLLKHGSEPSSLSLQQNAAVVEVIGDTDIGEVVVATYILTYDIAKAETWEVPLPWSDERALFTFEFDEHNRVKATVRREITRCEGHRPKRSENRHLDKELAVPINIVASLRQDVSNVWPSGRANLNLAVAEKAQPIDVQAYGNRKSRTDRRSALTPLHPWLDELLTSALQRTGSITAHISFLDSTRHLLCTYALGSHASVYSKTAGPSEHGATMLVAQTGKPQILPDVRGTKEWQSAMQEALICEDHEYRALLNSFGSEIALPFFGSQRREGRKQVIAVCSLHHAEKGGLNQHSLLVLRRLCRGVSKAIENALPYATAIDNAWWQNEMQNAIRRIREQSDDRSTRCPSLYDLIVEEGARLARAEVAGLWMSHEATNELHLAAVSAFSGANYSSFRVARSQGIHGKVFDSSAPHYCSDTMVDPVWHQCLPGIRSAYVIPLRRGGKAIGVLSFDSLRTAAFIPGLLKALDTFGELCSLLISKALAEMECLVVNRSRRSVADATNETDIYRGAVELACELAGAQGGSLFLKVPNAASLKLAFSTGLAPGFSVDPGYPLDDKSGITPWVAIHGVPLRLNNCADKMELRRWDTNLCWKGRTREVRSRQGFKRPHISVPIFDGKTTIGVLRVSGKRKGNRFLEEDKVALMQLANILVPEIRRPSTILSCLSHDIARVWPDREAFLNLILDRSIELSEADAGTIFVLESDSLQNCASRGELDCEPLSQAVQDGGVTALCATYRATQVVDDVEAEGWQSIYRPCFAGSHSEMVVPLIYLGKLCGVINLESKRKAFFSSEKRTYVESLAGVAAGYLLYQRLFDDYQSLLAHHRSEEATHLKYFDDLLLNATGPLKLPPGCDASGYVVSRPCNSAIGGDFHDTVMIDDHTVGVVLGGGACHGTMSALNMLPLLTAFRTHSRESRSTKHVLGKMITTAREMHVKGTAIYFIITKTQDGQWLLFGTSAGHPSLIIAHRTGGYSLFPRESWMNGGLQSSDNAEIGEDVVALGRGDLIIAFTDGIYEDPTTPRHSFQHTLLGIVNRSPDAGPETIARAAEQWALDKSGGRLVDDATIVVLRVGTTGEGSSKP